MLSFKSCLVFYAGDSLNVPNVDTYHKIRASSVGRVFVL